MVINQTTVLARIVCLYRHRPVPYPLWGTTLHGRRCESAVKLSTSPTKGDVLNFGTFVIDPLKTYILIGHKCRF